MKNVGYIMDVRPFFAIAFRKCLFRLWKSLIERRFTPFSFFITDPVVVGYNANPEIVNLSKLH